MEKRNAGTMNWEREALQQVQSEVARCDRCGACLTVCPLVGAGGPESAGARGKNLIVKALAEGGIEATAEALTMVNFCLLCRACTKTCPNGVETDRVMMEARRYLARRTGQRDIKKRIITAGLQHRGMVGLAAEALSLLRRLRLNGLVPWGLAPRECRREEFLSAFAGPAALGTAAPKADLPVQWGAKVAYFQGCGMRMFFPAASAATVKILQTATSVTVKNNFCCGLPHLARGGWEEFLALAVRNIALYEDADLIVSDCASCSGMLKLLPSFFPAGHVFEERAAAFSRRVMDLTEYLAKAGYRPRKRLDVKLTYHDPCHLVRGQAIREEPRRLVHEAGIFVEMKDAAACCGGAGSFHIDYPGISSAILSKKRENIEETGAAAVVTACPGCLIQLTKAARESGDRFKVIHISQVI